MVDASLQQYIQESRKAGMTDGQIHSSLSQSGWSEADITLALSNSSLASSLFWSRSRIVTLSVLAVILLLAGSSFAFGWGNSLYSTFFSSPSSSPSPSFSPTPSLSPSPFSNNPTSDSKTSLVNLPSDQVAAEVTVLSKIDERWSIKIDKINTYTRYPKATYPALKTGDIISVSLIGLFEPNNPQMGKKSILTPTIGIKYSAQLYMCPSKDYLYGCEPGKDWWAFLGSLESPIAAKLKIISPLNGSQISVGQTLTIKIEAADPLSREVLLVTPWTVEELKAPTYEAKLVVPAGVVGLQKIVVIGGDRESTDEITITITQ